MSRIGSNPVTVPKDVEVKILADRILAKGKLGELSMPYSADSISVTLEGESARVTPTKDDKKTRMMWGTIRALLANMVKGVSEGFTINMEMIGTGYRASVQGQNLQLQLGYSHDVIYPIPSDIKVVCERPTSITLSGPSKQKLGQMAAEIRSWRPPEPYKGKGIAFVGEQILRKEGKKK